MVIREPILSVDDQRRRLAWGAEGGQMTHYNAALEVAEDPAGCRVVWTTDLLPHELAEAVGAMQDQALAAMKTALEAAVRPTSQPTAAAGIAGPAKRP